MLDFWAHKKGQTHLAFLRKSFRKRTDWAQAHHCLKSRSRDLPPGTGSAVAARSILF